MILPLNLSPTLKAAKSLATRAALDADTLPGKLMLFAAPRPTEGAAASAPALATITLTRPSGTTDSNGFAITAAAPGQVLTTGDVVWGRFTDGAGNWVMDADVGLAAANKPLVIDAVTVYAGGFVSLVTAVLVEGG